MSVCEKSQSLDWLDERFSALEVGSASLLKLYPDQQFTGLITMVALRWSLSGAYSGNQKRKNRLGGRFFDGTQSWRSLYQVTASSRKQIP